jgi:hypothetical protein
MTALWLWWWLAAAQVSGGYRISGVVVNAATGKPVEGARTPIAATGQCPLSPVTPDALLSRDCLRASTI